MLRKLVDRLRYTGYVVLFLLFLGLENEYLYSQGSGGPQALPNAFAGGPPPPPGGGGGGNPVQEVPLDSDALFVLVIAGVTYLVFHHRRKWLIQKNITSNHGQ